MNEEMKNVINTTSANTTNVESSALELSEGGVEELLASIERKEQTLGTLTDSFGGEAGAQGAFEALPDPKKQALIDSIEAYKAKIKAVDRKIVNMGKSDDYRQGTNELFNLVRKGKVAIKEWRLKRMESK